MKKIIAFLILSPVIIPVAILCIPAALIIWASQTLFEADINSIGPGGL